MINLRSFFRTEVPPVVANTSHVGNGLPNNALPEELLESLTPLLGFGLQLNPLMKLFMVFNNLFGSRFGLDPTYVLTLMGLFWAARKLWEQLSMTFYHLAYKYFMCSVQIHEKDDIHYHLVKWLSTQPQMVNSRSLIAETFFNSAWEEELDESELNCFRVNADGSNVSLNFSNREAKVPPRFTPAVGSHRFWFRGRYFTLDRMRHAEMDPNAAFTSKLVKESDIMKIYCFGRSPEPIKQFLQHIKEQYYQDHRAKTIIRRPANQSMRRYSWGSWEKVAHRPVRPMRTVVLDDEEKIRVLTDMNEYLHPATPRWYATRGIPLRRGYLFHGPPGTGKTSLSFALAGVFGLDIYVISLLDPTLTEEDLLSLFNNLPRRCIVLLEDIDSAGLKRPEEPPEPKAAKSDSSSSSSESESSDDEKEESDKTPKSDDNSNKNSTKHSRKKSRSHKKSKKHPQPSILRRPATPSSISTTSSRRPGTGGDAEKKGISLSGLLNAIDGVASHEGRILIMTTNKPESLDEALIRPGRVDVQVRFTNATQKQARELFVRMYEVDEAQPRKPRAGGSPVKRLTETPKKPLPEKPLPEKTGVGLPSPPLTPASLVEEGQRVSSASARVRGTPGDGDMTDVSGATEVEEWDGDDERGACREEEEEDDEDTPKKKPVAQDNNNNDELERRTPTPSPRPRKPSPLTLPNHNQQQPGLGTESPGQEETQGQGGPEPPLTPTELSALASSFASLIPDGIFSPAELQGFLLKRKKSPRRAVREAKAWVEGMMVLKKGGKKVVGVH
ncbi:hypothetical protein VTJ04DRAFT_8060 [Mycothermus thermophilus]|uniref:uncharacterized protein n=1 Tax=Humicola insolens TaxID=85995 RepID=UPI0037439C49